MNEIEKFARENANRIAGIKINGFFYDAVSIHEYGLTCMEDGFVYEFNYDEFDRTDDVKFYEFTEIKR